METKTSSGPEKKAEVFTDPGKGFLGVASNPRLVEHNGSDGIYSSGTPATANYQALRRQAAEAMQQPDTFVCIVDGASDQLTIVAAGGGSLPSDTKAAQKAEGHRGETAVGQNCGPAKDFLKPKP